MNRGLDDIWKVDGQPMHYKLDADHKPVPVTLREWAENYEKRGHVLAQETVGDRLVSTIFLGLVGGTGEPYFETAILADDEVSVRERYPTYDDAMAGHAAIVAREKAKLK